MTDKKLACLIAMISMMSAAAVEIVSWRLQDTALKQGYRLVEAAQTVLILGAVGAWCHMLVNPVMRRSRHSESRARGLVSVMADSVYEHDAKGKITDTNAQARESTGYTMEEMLALHIWDIDVGTSREDMLGRWAAADGPLTIAGIHRHKDGSESPVEVRVAPGADGVFIAVARDVSDRVSADRQIRSALDGEKKTSGLLEHASGRLEQTARDLKLLMERTSGGEAGVRFDNPSLERCWEVKGCTVDCPAKSAPHLRCWEIADTLCCSEGESDKERRARCSACTVFINARTDPLSDLGETFNDMMHMLDTQKSRLESAVEEAQSANRAKSAFLANMSHEIRTPLTAILGFAEMLEMDGDLASAPKSRLGAISTIRRNGDHLLRIINDILDLSKMDADMLEVQYEVCRVRDTVAGVADSFHSLTAEGVDITVEADDVTVMSSPVRLRQILLNLIGNAAKFTKSGVIRVTATVYADVLTVDVDDDGPGMDWDQAEAIFAPFHQLDNSNTRNHGGTGLGLAISRRLAEAMGGSVDIVRAEPGAGCTFRLSVSAEGAEDVPIAQLARTVLPQGMRFLLVEDAPDNRDLISEMLMTLGAAKVDTAEDGEQGIARLIANEYDMVLMDMQMPVMDGWTAVQILRESGQDVPIVAVTADAGAAKRCIDAGCDGFLVKPLNARTMVSAVVAAIIVRSGEYFAGGNATKAPVSA